MQEMKFGRSNLVETAIVTVLSIVSLLLLGLVLAYWTWTWLGPSPEPRVEAGTGQNGDIVSAGLLFGKLERNQGAAAPTGIAIKLLGVVSASGGRLGYAVVRLEDKQILAVHEGEDIAPGIRLAEVHPEHVILERSGVRETLTWPVKSSTAGTATPAVNK